MELLSGVGLGSFLSKLLKLLLDFVYLCVGVFFPHSVHRYTFSFQVHLLCDIFRTAAQQLTMLTKCVFFWSLVFRISCVAFGWCFFSLFFSISRYSLYLEPSRDFRLCSLILHLGVFIIGPPGQASVRSKVLSLALICMRVNLASQSAPRFSSAPDEAVSVCAGSVVAMYMTTFCARK